MFLVDTDVISEARKREKSNAGVRAFFERAKEDATELHLSVVTIGELRQGVERGVHIRADGKAQVAEVIAGVHDHRERALRQHAIQTQGELGAADAA